MPADIVQKLNEAINAALKSPEIKDKLATLGASPIGGTPQDFAAVIKTDTAKFAQVVKEAKITID